MPAQFKAVMPVLVVDELEPTRAFFCDRLGFTERGTNLPRERPGRLIVERGSVVLVLQTVADLRADTGEDFVGGPYRAAVFLEVDDVELLVPEVIDADVVLPLRKTASGTNEIGIREPGGNIIHFGSRHPL